jgi:Subtilase family
MVGHLTLEAGVDKAAQVLALYDPSTATWNMTTKSEFWEAVRLAHSVGRTGERSTVAVIDGAFDTGVPAVRQHCLMWPNEASASTVHGTVVALLILAVAPATELLLYPVSDEDQLQPERVVRAINDARSRGVSVVNLSFGEARPFTQVFRLDKFYESSAYWPNMTATDRPYWIAERLSSGPKSQWLALPGDDLAAETSAAARDGITVVAAAGNHDGYVFSPAVLPEVFSVGFHREARSDSLAMERVWSERPSYLQSELVDFGIIQPPEVLGSSFATPLLAGFACLMTSRPELATFREVTRRAGMASELVVLAEKLAHGDRRFGVIEGLYNAAVNGAPHRHDWERQVLPCPECSLFALLAYNDYGLFKLNWRDLAGAELLLRTARGFAPSNAYAAANLGVTYASMANSTNPSNAVQRLELLVRARDQMRSAVALRPGYQAYHRRLDEFDRAISDPSSWRMTP